MTAFETGAEFFPVGMDDQWRDCGEKKNCWAITQATARSNCERSGSIVLEVRCQLHSFVYIHTLHHMFTLTLRTQTSTCAGPFGM